MVSESLLGDGALIARTESLAREERTVTQRLLRCLQEVERRELHLSRGHGSLFAWMCATLGYSEDQAQYRVDAMRAARDVPEAWSMLKEGTLSISNLVRAQRFFKQMKKRGEAYSVSQKREVILELQGSSLRKCERILAERSPGPEFAEKLVPVAGGAFQLSFVLNEEEMKGLEALRTFWGGMSFADTFKRLLKESLGKIPECGQSVTLQPRKTVEQSGETGPPRNRHIPRSLRREIWKRDGSRCAYISEETGTKCESTHGLQVDHVTPYAWGGEHRVENLRLLCRAHNLYLGRRMFGRRRA